MHTTRSAEHAGDYGVNYLVPNRRGQGQGKPVVKRPPPPASSQPLDDDFDAITQTQTGATTRAPETEWGTRVQESAVTRTSSPLPDDFDAATNTVVTPGPQRYTPAGSYWDQRQQQQQRQRGHVYSNSMPVNGGKAYANQGSSAHAHGNPKPKGEFEHYGEYGRYMDEMGRMFGGPAEVEVTAKKIGADVERRESRQIGKIPATTSNARRGHTRGKLSLGDTRAISRPTRLTPVNNRLSAKGPKPGQEYEIVDRRIVENTPERTVTIATWREQVAREADPNAERMSVHFMEADEYPPEDTQDIEPVARVESRINLDVGVNNENRSRTTIPDERFEEEYTRGSQEARTIESDNYSIERASPKSEVRRLPTPPRKNSTSNSSYMRRSESQQQRTTNYSHNSKTGTGSNNSWNQILQPPLPSVPPVNRPGPAVHNTPPVSYASPVVNHSTPVMDHPAPAVHNPPLPGHRGSPIHHTPPQAHHNSPVHHSSPVHRTPPTHYAPPTHHAPPAPPAHHTPPSHHTPLARNTPPATHHTPQIVHHTPQAAQIHAPAVQYTPPMVDRTPPRIQTPDRFQSTADPLPPSPLNHRSHQLFDESPPRSSTPVHSSPSPPRRIRTPLQESTPIRQRASASSFHPTRSGSTISSIKELPMVRFDQILESCEPSLLHIAPILANMGITNEAHLKAMKRLSDETRDKELKEEALRLGMTVMDWAILLDKIHTM